MSISRFTDPSGSVAQDWSQVATFTPTVSGEWSMLVRCTSDPSCTDVAKAVVALDRRPSLGPLTAVDASPCSRGLGMSWPRATFFGGASGHYYIHRSTIDCADALAQAPVSPRLTGTSWNDSSAPTGVDLYYVLVAENGSPATTCVPVGLEGGAITTSCFGPIRDDVSITPSVICWPLRVSHVGDDVTLDWSLARALAAAEHVHVGKGSTPTALPRVNPETEQRMTWTERDTVRRRQYFEIRYANACESQSIDEEPAGFDPPVGVPCP